ncbi:hypothetical protein FN846DRAFT_915675 [Sphaerosporella brunnea]|uniref:Uncharacterized protein n=1 Tax=Sphaerosporella brunnea TaxID=1250544 RepID=A0A5J5FBN5_9PEZI|nr:hypothetical protein FN846DRAFT_915675 [Sphaerosporella brunnea]
MMSRIFRVNLAPKYRSSPFSSRPTVRLRQTVPYDPWLEYISKLEPLEAGHGTGSLLQTGKQAMNSTSDASGGHLVAQSKSGTRFPSISRPINTVENALSKKVISSNLTGAAAKLDRKDQFQEALIQHARKILCVDETCVCTKINRTGLTLGKKWFPWVYKMEAKTLPWMIPFREWSPEQQNAALDCMEWNVIGLEIDGVKVFGYDNPFEYIPQRLQALDEVNKANLDRAKQSVDHCGLVAAELKELKGHARVMRQQYIEAADERDKAVEQNLRLRKQLKDRGIEPEDSVDKDSELKEKGCVDRHK